jgi:hypothetical protein
MGLSTGCGYAKNAITTTFRIYNMKKRDLLQLIAHMSDEDEVVVTLKQSGVGGTPCTPVSTVGDGFDWDNGKILLTTETPVVTQEHLDRIQKYCRAYEKLLYLYAMENNLSFMGQPLMGSKMCPKGGAARAFKEYMKRDAEGYLGNV